MDAVTRVNLHCHSLFSNDGALTPETLADNLAAAGVRYAALTDHDTVEGLPRFQEALKRRGIGYIPGVEITARCDGREMHLIGLGFDADHAELNATLRSLRQARDPGLHSIAGALRNCRRAPEVARALVESGARPRNITRMISSICDAATERFIPLAEAELGPPPAPFAFIAMGSQGRQEPTLVTDQDNPTIFANPASPAELTAATDYFLKLGAKVCSWLEQAGYPACRGGFMAGNPRWCRSLSDWQAHFSSWISRAEPQELLEFSIFFDFRVVHGNAGLTSALRRHIHMELAQQPAFFPHLPRAALRRSPPVRLIGNIYLGGSSAERAGQLDLEDTVMSLVDFARLYALRHAIDHTHARLPGRADRARRNTGSHDRRDRRHLGLSDATAIAATACVGSGRPDAGRHHRSAPSASYGRDAAASGVRADRRNPQEDHLRLSGRCAGRGGLIISPAH